MQITQGATALFLFPVQDAAGVDVDLTTLTNLCFLLSGANQTIQKQTGSTGFLITDYAGGTNNALQITLSPDETSPLTAGRLYRYWLWGEGADGTDALDSGEATVTYAEQC